MTESLSGHTFFTVGDCRNVPYGDNNFDVVLILGNSFGYFSSEDQDKKVLLEVLRVLKPGGRLILDIADGEHLRKNYSERSWEWIDDSTFVCRERQLSDDQTRLVAREIITLTGKGVVRDQFYQERLYSFVEINNLMREMGFMIGHARQINISTQSKRNEDVGMMDNRLVVSSTKPDLSQDLTALSIPKEYVPHVTIFLGDPSRTCVGKLNNTWNQEDIETREKLVEAISNIEFISDVKVIDRHSEILLDLTANKPAFVLNLCDEGWFNDALKELHVPALLEMLQIPYSGAGPNCLAFCYDKGLVNRSAEVIGIPTPNETTFLGSQIQDSLLEGRLKDLTLDLEYPSFVKPIKGDNSLGITVRSVVQDFQELLAYVKELRSLGLYDVLIQEYLQGTEYSVGMIGNNDTGFTFFPILEVNYKKIVGQSLPPILGFESKWDPKSPYWTDISYERATSLSEDDEVSLRQFCKILWERFGCCDYARFDFRSDSRGVIKLLEVNPNPGWCWDGKFAHMGRLHGLSYAQIFELILKTAWKRLKMDDCYHL
jgi:D-alanine-D-alanine ligase